jgi:hypothetical protein
MSVASINNGTLQLSDLIVSNEKYSNSSGYIPSTATFSAGLTGTSIYVPAISATDVTIGTSPNTATLSFVDGIGLSCDQGFGAPDLNVNGSLIQSDNNIINVNSLSINGTPEGPSITLSSPSSGTLEVDGQVRIDQSGSSNYVNLSCTGLGELNVESILLGVEGSQVALSAAPSFLQVSGSINCNTITGAIGTFQGSLTPSVIGPQVGYFFPEVTISNFTGSATTSYTISSNYTNNAVFVPFIWSVQFVSADPETNTTIVSVAVFNASTTYSYGGQPSAISIIAVHSNI